MPSSTSSRRQEWQEGIIFALSLPLLAALAFFVLGCFRLFLVPSSSMEPAFSPGSYVLKAGGNPVRGKEIYAVRCSACHGADGTRELFDDGEFSLGSHARQKAYEDWFKIANGQPGTAMESQVSGSGKERTQQILDLLAALCDRTAFPVGKAKGKDVPNNDPRCGAYLK